MGPGFQKNRDCKYKIKYANLTFFFFRNPHAHDKYTHAKTVSLETFRVFIMTKGEGNNKKPVEEGLRG